MSTRFCLICLIPLLLACFLTSPLANHSIWKGKLLAVGLRVQDIGEVKGSREVASGGSTSGGGQTQRGKQQSGWGQGQRWKNGPGEGCLWIMMYRQASGTWDACWAGPAHFLPLPSFLPSFFVFSPPSPYSSSFTQMSCISLPWYGVASPHLTSPHASLTKAVRRY